MFLEIAIALVAIMFIATVAWNLIIRFFYWVKTRPYYRESGHVLSVLAIFFVFPIAGGLEEEASLYYMLYPVGIGLGMIGLGWLINHWPLRSPRRQTNPFRRDWEQG